MTPNAVTLLPGRDNIKSVYERILKSKKADFVCLSTGYEAVIGDWYDGEFAPKLMRTVATREIVAETDGNRRYASQKDGAKNQVRFLSEAAESDLIVCDTFAAIVSFNPGNPYAVVIEDDAIVNSTRVWFETMWHAAAR